MVSPGDGSKQRGTEKKGNSKAPKKTVLKKAKKVLSDTPNARRLRERKAKESPEAKEKRREKDKFAQQRCRDNETEEHHDKRVVGQKIYQQRKRGAETPEETKQRQLKQQKIQDNLRAAETPEEKKQRQSKENLHQAEKRAAETPEETKQRQLRNRKEQEKSRTNKHKSSGKTVPDFETLATILEEPNLLDFSHFERNPETAILLFHLNRMAAHLQSDDPDKLWEEIQNELPTEDELETMIKKFQEAQGATGPIRSCGACGVKGLSCKEIGLSDLQKLRMDEQELGIWESEKRMPPVCIPLEEGGEMEYVQLHKARSVYESNQDSPLTSGNVPGAYFVHPELVHVNKRGREMTYICGTCEDVAVVQDCVPPNSIKAGVDFGDFRRLGLTLPNVFEQAILARCRLVRKVVKIQNDHRMKGVPLQHQMKKHMIAFPHDAPNVAAEVLDLSKSRDVTICFSAADGKTIDRMMAEALERSFLKARGFVLYQWLVVLSSMNRRYKDLEFPSVRKVDSFASSFNEKIREEVLRDAKLTEDEMGVGDDVAEVRTGGGLEGTNSSRDIQGRAVEQDDAGAESIPCVFVQSDSGSENLEKQTGDLLREIAKAFNVEGGRSNIGVSRRTTPHPLTDYSDNDKLLCGAFPHIFMLGVAYEHGKVLQGKKPGSPLTLEEARHLLRQFTNHPSTCKDLIFLLFNQMSKQRNATGTTSSVGVRGSRSAFRRFSVLANSKGFKQRLKKAVENPTSQGARVVLRELMPILKLAARKNTVGAVSCSNFPSHMYASSRHYGPGSIFFTIAPDDVNNPTTFRFAQRFVNNKCFPAEVENEDSFFEDFVEGSVEISGMDIPVPSKWVDRVAAATNNPVATALEYNRMVDNIMTILFGLTLNKHKKRTTYFKQNPRGIFGHLVSALGVHETQARGALHNHIVLWGGIPPGLLQRVASDADLVAKIASILDKMYSSQLSREQHVENLLRKHVPSSAGISLHSMHKPALTCGRRLNVGSVDELATKSLSQCAQIHTHSFTCSKGLSGVHRCRLAFRQSCNGGTSVVQLKKRFVDDPPVDSGDVVEDGVVSNERDHGKQLPQGGFCFGESGLEGDHLPYVCLPVVDEMECEQTRKKGPLLLPDDRVLAWELARPQLESLPSIPEEFALSSDHLSVCDEDTNARRSRWIVDQLVDIVPESAKTEIQQGLRTLTPQDLDILWNTVDADLPCRNGYVVPFNPTITALTGSNTCVSFLGNVVQSNNILNYLRDYLAKDKAEVAHILSVVKAVGEEIEKPGRQSVAKDSGTADRTAKHWLQRVLNQLDLGMEISDTQAVAAIFGMETEISTDCYTLLGIHEANNYRKYHVKKAYSVHRGDSGSSSDSSYDGEEDDGSVESSSSSDVSIAIDSEEGPNSGNETVETLTHVDYKIGEDVGVEERDDAGATDVCVGNEEDDEGDDAGAIDLCVGNGEDDEGDEYGLDGPVVLDYPRLSEEEAAKLGAQFELDDVRGPGWGAAKIYRVQEKDNGTDPTLLHVPPPEHYNFRGKDLKDINRVEYYCLVGHRKSSMKETNGTPEDTSNETEKKGGKKKKGRASSKEFDFATDHQLANYQRQYLFSKQYLPIHTGYLPEVPDLDDIPDEDDETYKPWRKKADEFAEYYLMAFRPEIGHFDQQPMDLDYSWEAFESFCEYLLSSERFIDWARYDMMMTTITATKTRKDVKQMLTCFRNRSVDYWDNEEKEEARLFWSNRNRKRQELLNMNDFEDGIDKSTGTGELSQRSLQTCQEVMEFSEGLIASLGMLHPSNETVDGSSPPNPLEQNKDGTEGETEICYACCNPRKNPVYCKFSGKHNQDMKKMFEKMETYEPEGATAHIEMSFDGDSSSSDDDGNGWLGGSGDPNAMCTDLRGMKAKAMKIIKDCGMEWTKGQQSLLDDLLSTLCEANKNRLEPSSDRDPPLVLCTGGPGTGKTSVLRMFPSVSEVMGVCNVIRTAFMGVAAVQARGKTFLKTFMLRDSEASDVGVIRPLKDDGDLQKLRKELGITANTRYLILIVDEVSMITATHLVLADVRLRQATGVDRPFGGIPVFLFGDFSQLPPVNGILLCQALMEATEVQINRRNMRWNKTHPGMPPKPIVKSRVRANKNGSSAFTSTKDKYRIGCNFMKGCELFKKFRWFPLKEQTRSKDENHTKFVEGMGRGEPIKLPELKQYKILDENDYRQGWKFATVVVATNRERLDVTEQQVLAFAKENGLHVLRWRRHIDAGSWIGKPSRKELRKMCIDNDPVFWQYFVYGAPIFLTDNINVSNKMANGTVAVLHSINMGTKQLQEELIQQLRETPVGAVVTLSAQPHSVNIELFHNDEDDEDLQAREDWKCSTLVHDRVVVPIVEQSKRSARRDSERTFHVRGGLFKYGYLPSRVTVTNHFPYELGFASTFHKIQGKTVARVIVFMSNGPLSSTVLQYASVFVAMSRVEYGDNIRILLMDGERLSDLTHLTSLQPCPEIQQYFAGFEGEDSRIWNEEKAFMARYMYYTAKQNSRRNKKRGFSAPIGPGAKRRKQLPKPRIRAPIRARIRAPEPPLLPAEERTTGNSVRKESQISQFQMGFLEDGQWWDSMEGDGNCLFYAIQTAFPQLGDHMEIRQRTADWLRNSDDLYFSTDDAMINSIMTDEDYSREDVISVIAHCFSLNFRVVGDHNVTPVVGRDDGSDGPSFDLTLAMYGEHFYVLRDDSPTERRSTVVR